MHLSGISTDPFNCYKLNTKNSSFSYLCRPRKLCLTSYTFTPHLIILSKVTRMLQFLYQMFNLFALLRDDLLKPATPLTNCAIDETLQHVAPLSDDCLLQLVDLRDSSTSINHLLKNTPNSAIDWIQVRAVWGHMRRSMNVTFSRRRYVGVFLAVCDGAPSCRRHQCKMLALLLQNVRVTLDNN